ncbi:trehalose 6-phosphate synthase [Thermosporothrix hazakensis]|uniref:Trehalose 6-phosphate synthase n=1 Tax=Thermosporothrix hazakensis TaxID=644383 RepID=A0A326U2N1_THEHA|nr:trehalose-6-phosphate synthase [Thermosporothrix hazakensis]PZW25702.1 trehalose 6-phosphate synthase [Thermosporothrix hazakensis]GCE48197.1 trehalose-6-phosphate synthase [Thermosporothrix hazakensis]
MPTRTTTDAPPQLMHARRLIIASNRGPVEFQLSQDGSLKARRGAGGMVTALIEIAKSMDVTWVAVTMTEGDRVAVREMQQHGGVLPSPVRGHRMKLHYVPVQKNVYRKYYDKISNEVLWFLQHYMYDPYQSNIRQLQDAWTNGYCEANRELAEAVVEEIEREDSLPVVMLQDYHLYLVSSMIRKKHPSIIMQQFIHIPWPDIRCWHFLPSNIAQAIYSGLVGNDIIGFQTERDARNFLEGARTILDGAVVDFEEGAVWWQGHRTQARAYPISISVTEERRVVNSAPGKRAAKEIQQYLREYNIMRVDRIEPTKNILRGFQAYDLLLEEHPELHGKVAFLAFLVPSRQSLPIYRRTALEVQAIIDEINQKYGSDDWTPIQAFTGNDRARALAAMQYYDVLLVNPIIDGMNLVAKEGPVVNQRDGVLVLSRTVGAFQQLGKGSIPTSPTDVIETAQALYKALMLPEEERHAKATFVRQSVERNNLDAWLARQIRDINELLEYSVASQAKKADTVQRDASGNIVANVS